MKAVKSKVRFASRIKIKRKEKRETFLREGIEADKAMARSGLGYAAKDVHAYLGAKVAGRKPRKPRKPRPVRWRA